MKNWLKNFIDRLAKSNDETFHGQIPDCCGNLKGDNSDTVRKPAKSGKYSTKQ